MKCPLCKKIVQSINDLKKHFRKIHGKEFDDYIDEGIKQFIDCIKPDREDYPKDWIEEMHERLGIGDKN